MNRLAHQFLCALMVPGFVFSVDFCVWLFLVCNSALQVQAGTDVLAIHARAALPHPRAVLVSLDGCSRCDSMSQAAFLGKLLEVAPELLPFVRLFYGPLHLLLVGLRWPLPGCSAGVGKGTP